MAEETQDTQQEATPAGLSQDQLESMIRNGTKAAMQEALQDIPRPQPAQPAQPENPFQQWVDPLVKPGLQQAQLQAEIAQDKADFYSSDLWLDEVDDHLISDDPKERRQEKSDLRKQVEKLFEDNIKAGQPRTREALMTYLLGQRAITKKADLRSAQSRREQKSKDADLDKARRGVDISAGLISDFSPQSVQEMSLEDMRKKYAEVSF